MDFMSIQELRRKYHNCKKCNLWEDRTNVVFGRGNREAKIIIVGGAPSESEDEDAIPFVGASGRLLDWMLKQAGSSRNDVWTTNAIMCRPVVDDGGGRIEDRAPAHDEIQACQERLYQEIISLDPDFLVLMGEGALRTLYGTRHPKIGNMVGRVYEIDIPCPEEFTARYAGLVLHHPSYLLRVDAAKDENGPTVQAVDMLRTIIQVSDFLELLREHPENALSRNPDLPDRGKTLTALGEI